MLNKKSKNFKNNNNNNSENNNNFNNSNNNNINSNNENNNNKNNNNNNDFWDESNEKFFTDNESDYFNNKLQTKQKEKLYKKYKYLIKKYDENETINKIKQKNEQLKLINKKKCDELYEKAKKFQKNKIKKLKENNEIQTTNELKECTFFPNIKRFITNENNNNIININNDIYERNKLWLINKKENLIKVKRKYSNNSKSFNYTPEIHLINEKNLENIFNEENNIINQPENYYFLIRQINCRNKIKNNNNNNNENIKNIYLKNSHYSNKIYQKVSNNNINNIKLQLHNEILNF